MRGDIGSFLTWSSALAALASACDSPGDAVQTSAVEQRVQGPVCPALGADTDCGTVITITPTGAKIVNTPGQGPYDQIEDSLVGVVNNSNQPIAVMQVRSALPIFAFDGDGVCGTDPNTGLPFNPRPPGCPFGPTTYEGPGVTFTDMSPDRTSGTIHFNPPIPTGGGTAYFTLEENIQNVCSCADVLNNSVVNTPGGRPSLDGKNTSLSATFTPQCGGSGGNPPTLRDAAFFCGFTEFDWQQTFTRDPAPTTVCPAGSTVPVTAPPPYNDPPLVGWSYQTPPNAVILPVYWNLFTGASDPLSLAANELPTHDLSSTSLFYEDGPGNVCLPGPQDPVTAAFADSVCGAPCGSTISGAHNRAPAGSQMEVTTRLVGIVGFLPGASIQDTGIGFDWTSNFNGTTGGISVRNSVQPVDANSGSGGVTVTRVHNTTTYDYNGIVVTTVNGNPIGSDTTPPVITASADPATLWPPNGKVVSVTVSGTIADSEAGASGVDPASATFAVTDEYGAVQPAGSVAVDASGAYGVAIPLQASRNGSDRDGRLYTITIAAKDNAGNPASVTVNVTVPHDQGN